MKLEDEKNIDRYVDILLEPEVSGLYFDEFKEINLTVASDMYLAVFDCLYYLVPCAKTYFIMRSNYWNCL